MDTSRPTQKYRAGRMGLNPARGLAFALIFGVVGFLSPILLGLVFTVCRWVILASDDFDRAYDLGWLPTYLVYPAVGTAIVFSATGWAWRAADGPYRFTPTLLIIFAACVPAWFILSQLDRTLNPPHYPYKGSRSEDSPIEPTFVLIMALPAFTTAFVLSMIRALRASVAMSKAPPDPELA